MAEANKISRLLHVLPESERFPVDIKKIAIEISSVRYKDAPITRFETFDIDGVDGLLGRHPSGRKWKIGHNSQIRSPGRIRFTQAHEFGHYILHRELRERFLCSTKDMHEWDEKSIEAEADVFASFLLMPLDDYRNQIAGQAPSIDLLRHCSSRYGVSMMAAALKWTEIAPKRSVVLAARDGFVLWARSNNAAFRSKAYLASRKHTIPVPEASVLNRASTNEPITSLIRANAWFPSEPADVELVEHALAVEGDFPYTLAILVLPESTPQWGDAEDELLAPVNHVVRRVQR